MAETEQNRLDVETTLKADGFAVGAKQIETSSQTAGTAAVKLSDIIRKTGEAGASAAPSLSRTGDSVEKLKRTLIDGYAAAQQAERAINGISKAMAAGNLAGDELTRSIDGVIRKYGLLAAESVAASKGTLQNAAAVELLNARLKEQANLRPAGVNDNNRAFRQQNLGYQLFDVGQGLAAGAPAALILAQQGPQIVQMYAGQGGVGAAFRDLTSILGGVARAAGPVIAILSGVYGAYKILQTYSVEAGLAVDDATRSLAAQAASASSLTAAVNELSGMQKAYSDALLTTASSQTEASRSILANTEREFNAKQKLLEIEMKRQEAAQKVLESEIAIQGLHFKQDLRGQVSQDNLVASGFADPNGVRFTTQLPLSPDGTTALEKLNAAVSKSPVPDLLAEMQAKSTLTEIAVGKLREGLKLAFNAGADLIAQGNDAGFAKAKSYTEALLAIEKAQRAIYNPVNIPAGVQIPIPGNRPQNFNPNIDEGLSKTESAYEQLSQAAAKRIAQMQNEMSIVGQSANMQARLRAEFEAEAQYREQIARDGAQFNQAELDALKQKAAALASINAQLSAQKLLAGQQDQIQQLQLEASLIGASAEERARATAALQAEQNLRQQGIDLMSREADQYRANAVAIAETRLEIERQSAAYAAAQQAGGQLIDQMFVGTGSIEDRLKSMANTLLTTFQQLAVANPLKNQLLGTNLPTLSDLFSGRPSVPGATSTAMMTVTAGTVMLNGGLPGLPGMTPGGGLSDLLGYKPANQNAPSGDIEAYIRQSAVRHGIDPETAIKVAQSEGGLNSWNLQSNYVRNGVQEPSYGPFQLYKGGGLGNEFQNRTGLDPALAANGPAGVDFALDHASKNGWSAWNGAKRVGVNQWDGIDRSAQAANQNLLKLSTTSTTAAKDIGGLGDSSFTAGKSLTDVFGQGANPALNQFPAAPVVTPTAPVPAGGGNILTSLFGGFFKLLGFADGTEFAPGGPAIVGERGIEVVNLPRGAHVTPNHEIVRGNGGSGRALQVKHEYIINVSGNGDKDLMERMRAAAEETVRVGIDVYDTHHLPGRMKQIAGDPFVAGG